MERILGVLPGRHQADFKEQTRFANRFSCAASGIIVHGSELNLFA